MADIQATSITAKALGMTPIPTMHDESLFETYQVAVANVSTIPHFGDRHRHMLNIASEIHIWLYNTPHHLIPIVGKRVLVPKR